MGGQLQHALSTLPFPCRQGTRMGSTRQPPCATCSAAPSLAGGRELCGCSAHLPPPESPALKLPGCGQPVTMETASSILAIAFISKPSGRTEEQGSQRRERKLWPGYTAFPALPNPLSSRHPAQGSPAAQACPLPPGVATSIQLHPRPTLTPGGPWWREVWS